VSLGRRLVCALVGVAALTGCSAGGPEADRQLPDVTVREFSGEGAVSVAALRGPLVINLWASYCKPCRQEMPVLEEFHQVHGDQVEVVGIDYQDPQQGEAEELAAETGVTYRLLSDPLGELNSADPFPNLMGLPFLALVDEDGKVAHMEYGEVESVGELERLVNEHLDVDL
jgi:cytochrome c biogenesis protein CcmG/thiol:disulfide interchange protein DsbE